MKRCTKCKLEKADAEFQYQSKKNKKLKWWCRECSRDDCKNRYMILHPLMKPRVKAMKKGHKYCNLCEMEKPKTYFAFVSLQTHELQAYCKACINKRTRARDSGFTQEIWDMAWIIQQGRCAICCIDLQTLSPYLDNRSAVHADHDHRAGAPRGILCGNCNRGLGSFKDSVAALRQAVDYLDNPPLKGLDV